MNREIIFKAKRVDNGRWVEGGYFSEPYTDKKYIVRWNSFGIGFNEFIEVNPDTLCQYTGLTDKNGQKIWENDIVSINAYSYYEPEDDYFGVVKYSSKDACWCLCGEVSDIICECFGSYTTEINKHGNIFDNPELLEVE